jgi:hypothetical protein
MNFLPTQTTSSAVIGYTSDVTSAMIGNTGLVSKNEIVSDLSLSTASSLQTAVSTYVKKQLDTSSTPINTSVKQLITDNSSTPTALTIAPLIDSIVSSADTTGDIATANRHLRTNGYYGTWTLDNAGDIMLSTPDRLIGPGLSRVTLYNTTINFSSPGFYNQQGTPSKTHYFLVNNTVTNYSTSSVVFPGPLPNDLGIATQGSTIIEYIG